MYLALAEMFAKHVRNTRREVLVDMVCKGSANLAFQQAAHLVRLTYGDKSPTQSPRAHASPGRTSPSLPTPQPPPARGPPQPKKLERFEEVVDGCGLGAGDPIYICTCAYIYICMYIQI